MTKQHQQTVTEVVYNVITCTHFVFGVCALCLLSVCGSRTLQNKTTGDKMRLGCIGYGPFKNQKH